MLDGLLQEAPLRPEPGPSLLVERAASTTRMPNSDARRAVAAPMPLPAPVITSTGWSDIRRVLAILGG
jgi:hypothetical protein